MTDDVRYDVRLVERMLASGRLSREEHQKYLDSLPDLSSKATTADPTGEGDTASAEASARKKARKK